MAVVNDFYAQQLYDLVGTLIERWGLGEPDELRNALLAGDSQVDSVLPVQSLMALAGAVRASSTLKEIFDAESDPKRLWQTLRDHPECAEFRRRFDEHLARFGDRTLHELKLETPSLREDPAYAVSMLQRYVRAPRTVGHADASAHRREAERTVRARLRHRPDRRAALAKLSSYAREAIRHRENLRLARARGFGLVKRIFGALARQFVSRGVLDDPGDIFFLTVDEVRGAVRGHGVSRDLRALVASRRREYAAYRERTPPLRIVTRGMVGAATFSRAEARRGGGGADELVGLGCSRGVARGPAAVVLEPRRDLDVTGAILVAPATDPGWVFLMVTAEGLIVERGSMLSHTAIIGRELGIPTVVGVEGASERIADGDRLEIDGSAGVVRITARAERVG